MMSSFKGRARLGLGGTESLRVLHPRMKGRSMKLSKTRAAFTAIFAVIAGLGATPAHAVPPNPVLYLTGTEFFSTGGQNFIRYRYDVFNKDQYPADMFAAAPALAPCGNNHNSARSWVDFFDQRAHRLNGFCALGSPNDLR